MDMESGGHGTFHVWFSPKSMSTIIHRGCIPWAEKQKWQGHHDLGEPKREGWTRGMSGDQSSGVHEPCPRACRSPRPGPPPPRAAPSPPVGAPRPPRPISVPKPFHLISNPATNTSRSASCGGTPGQSREAPRARRAPAPANGETNLKWWSGVWAIERT
jgi:hypothetical protein